MTLGSLVIFCIINMTNVGSGSVSLEATFGISTGSLHLIGLLFTSLMLPLSLLWNFLSSSLGLPSISQLLPWYLVHDHQSVHISVS